MGLVVVVFLILLFLGMPVAFSIAISGTTFFLTNPNLPLSIVVQRAFSTTQSFTMLAIPLFIFAGNLMNNTGITVRLIKLANVLAGHMYGSMGQVSVLLSTMMGGVSGSAVADAAMQSRILGPEMTKRGYPRGYTAALNGLTAMIVATLPPSMGLIIFGSVGEVSIGRLFAGGIMPGFILMIAFMIAVAITSRRHGLLPEKDKPSSLMDIFICLKECIWALIFPLLLIVFIRFGIMTPSESGAFAVFYALFVGIFVYKELTFQKFLKTLADSTKDIAIITMVIAFSGIFGFGIVVDRVPQAIVGTFLDLTGNPVVMFAIILIFIAAIGMFMESTVVVLLLTPILLPVATSVGIDPVHFGVVMMTVVTTGIMTPPVGVALFAVSSIMECSVEETLRHSGPFFLALITTVIIMVLFPQVVLFLPNLIYG